MSELVNELRRHEREYPSLIHGPLCGKAAAEIERLRLEHQHACQEIGVAIKERDEARAEIERLRAQVEIAAAQRDAMRIVLGNQLAMMGALHQLMRGFLAPDALTQERLSARIQATRALTDPVPLTSIDTQQHGGDPT
jgi:hypothetical protein